MEILYARSNLDPITWDTANSIFLAGPTPRDDTVRSWRPLALDILAKYDFNGYVVVPEYSDGIFTNAIDIEAQIEWEEKGLTYATCILFWIPRDMAILPGLTTNDEWGTWKYSGKVVLGGPDTAHSLRYQKYYANKLGIPFSNDLSQTIVNALELVKRRGN